MSGHTQEQLKWTYFSSRIYTTSRTNNPGQERFNLPWWGAIPSVMDLFGEPFAGEDTEPQVVIFTPYQDW